MMINATLQRHLDNNRIAASYLVIDGDIENLRGISKWFATYFNAADVFYLAPKPDAKSIQVAETLDFMQAAHLAPVGERKLFIICDTATMTIAAQNKMLKTLEDAPAATTFLLLATTPTPILHTIKSRCVTVFSPAAPSDAPLIPPETVDILKKMFGIEIDEKNLTPEQKYKIMQVGSRINRNVAANCNPQNQSDAMLIELLRIIKPGN